MTPHSNPTGVPLGSENSPNTRLAGGGLAPGATWPGLQSRWLAWTLSVPPPRGGGGHSRPPDAGLPWWLCQLCDSPQPPPSASPARCRALVRGLGGACTADPVPLTVSPGSPFLSGCDLMLVPAQDLLLMTRSHIRVTLRSTKVKSQETGINVFSPRPQA